MLYEREGEHYDNSISPKPQVWCTNNVDTRSKENLKVSKRENVFPNSMEESRHMVSYYYGIHDLVPISPISTSITTGLISS